MSVFTRAIVASFTRSKIARAPQPSRKGSATQPKRQQHTADFGDERGAGHALHAPTEAENEQKIQPDVQCVHRHLQQEDPARALQRDQPSGESVERDRQRRAPDADLQVVAGKTLDLVAPWGKLKSGPEQRKLQHDEAQPGDPRNDQRAHQPGGHLAGVARPMRLAHQPGCAHPEEAEDPVERGQDHRSDPHRPDRRGQADLADDSRVDRAEDRDRGVREDDGQRDLQDPRMGNLSHWRRYRPARASGSVRSPARRSGSGCLATPRHGRWRNAAPSG